jgi:hypothetical protein
VVVWLVDLLVGGCLLGWLAGLLSVCLVGWLCLSNTSLQYYKVANSLAASQTPILSKHLFICSPKSELKMMTHRT